MNRVYPIKEKDKIERLKDFMKTKGKYRDLLLFVIGINTPLHLSDILSMKWKLFLTDSEEIKEVNSEIVIGEENASKMKSFVLSSSIREALKLHFDHYPYISKSDYVFASQKTENGKIHPITRQYAWALLNKYAKAVGIKERVGAHTLRKTFGYHLCKKGIPISCIQKLLNQPNASMTLRYIGVSQEEYKEQRRRILTPNL